MLKFDLIVISSYSHHELIDEDPIKVDSQLLSITMEPDLPKPLKTPIVMTFANDDVSNHQSSFS